jgi:RNA polymerase sigma factor for flagellar operon FliA
MSAEEGLLDAVHRFKLSAGVEFRTYAPRRILGAIHDYLRSVDYAPRTLRIKEKKRQEAEKTLEPLLGRPPHPDEVRRHLKWTNRDYQDSILAQPSLNHTVFITDGGKDVSVEQLYVEEPTQDRFEWDDSLKHKLRGLSLQEQTIMYLYHFCGRTMKQIGVSLSLSESRISQMHTRIIQRLRYTRTRAELAS